MKRFFLQFIFTFALLVSPAAYSFCDKELSIRLEGWSKHTISSQRDDGERWNEVHNIRGISCNRWSAFVFENSWGKEAYSLTYETEGYNFTKRLRGSWLVGGWSGYEGVVGDLKVLPVLVPKLEYRVGPVAVESLLAGVVFTASFRIYF